MTPRVRRIIFVVIAILIGSYGQGFVVDNIRSSSRQTSTQSPSRKQVASAFSALMASEPDRLYGVVRVVDGDTIVIKTFPENDESGDKNESENNQEKEITLRLIGVDTPETVDPRKAVQCFGREASDMTKSLLHGERVRLENDSSQTKTDKYDRLLAYVYRSDGLFINKYLIENGYAHEYTYGVPYKYQTNFKLAEKQAREKSLGLWAPQACR